MNYQFLSVSFFLLGFIAGFMYLDNSFFNIKFSDSNNSILLNLENNFTFINIVSSNVKVIILNILGGMTFGVFTCVNLMYNGLAVSYIVKLIYIIDSKYYLVLIPHSFEIIAMILSGAIGIELGYFLFSHIFLSKKKKLYSVRILKKILISVLIIIIAALIEVYISPNII